MDQKITWDLNQWMTLTHWRKSIDLISHNTCCQESLFACICIYICTENMITLHQTWITVERWKGQKRDDVIVLGLTIVQQITFFLSSSEWYEDSYVCVNCSHVVALSTLCRATLLFFFVRDRLIKRLGSSIHCLNLYNWLNIPSEACCRYWDINYSDTWEWNT